MRILWALRNHVNEGVAVTATARGGRPPRIRPEEILDLLAARIDDSWTMAGIAAELGVSEAAVYYYFPTKSDLLRALGQRLFANLQLPQVRGDWAAWLADLGMCLFDFFVRYPLITSAGVDLLGETVAESWPAEGMLATLVAEGLSIADADTALTTIIVLASGYASMAAYLAGPRGRALKARITRSAALDPDSLSSRDRLLPGAWDIRERLAASLAATVTGLRTLHPS